MLPLQSPQTFLLSQVIMDDTKMKPASDHVEDLGMVRDNDVLQGEVEVMGTVKLTHGKIIYIPTPTADPQGKRNQDSVIRTYLSVQLLTNF